MCNNLAQQQQIRGKAQSVGLQERFHRRLEDTAVSDEERRLAGEVVEQYVQDSERRARGASVNASCMASPPPRRSMPSGLLAAGGHDVNWRSLRSALSLALKSLDACLCMLGHE